MIYIQSNDEKLPHHFDAASALYGAEDSGLDFKLITFEQVKVFYALQGRNFLTNNLFVGSVEFMTLIFNYLHKSPRVELNSNRVEEFITLLEAKNRVINGETLFIKPKQIKLFTGMVCKKDFIFCLNPYPDETEVIVSKPFEHEIVSEWRCYIYKNIIGDDIADIRNYLGDPFIVPNRDYIKSIINDNPNFPIAYTIDIGILENGENVVIEFNDMWAIGNYGMENDKYLRLLKARYFEIIKE